MEEQVHEKETEESYTNGRLHSSATPPCQTKGRKAKEENPRYRRRKGWGSLTTHALLAD